MKKLTTITLALLLFIALGSCGNSGAKSNDNTEADYKTIYIEYVTDYEMMGAKISEKENLWIDQKNGKQVSHSYKSSSIMGIENKEETLTINDGEWDYNIDMINKTGTKTNIADMKEAVAGMAGALSIAFSSDIKSMEDFVTQNGGKILENEIFLGKECLVYELMNTKNWMYKGNILKTEMGGKIIKQAVKVDENIKFPDGTFDVPSGINISEIKGLSD